MLLYALAILVAVVGGLAGPIAAHTLQLEGLAAYGLFLAGVAVFIPLAGVLHAGAKARGFPKPQHR